MRRFELDFGLLQNLENDLDELVRGASVRMATGFRGRHIFRRDVWQQGSPSGEEGRTNSSTEKLSRRRVIPASSSSSDAAQPPRVEMDWPQQRLERTQDRTIWSLANVLRGEQPPLLPMITTRHSIATSCSLASAYTEPWCPSTAMLSTSAMRVN